MASEVENEPTQPAASKPRKWPEPWRLVQDENASGYASLLVVDATGATAIVLGFPSLEEAQEIIRRTNAAAGLAEACRAASDAKTEDEIIYASKKCADALANYREVSAS